MFPLMVLTKPGHRCPASQGHSEKTIGPARASKPNLPAKASIPSQPPRFDIVAGVSAPGSCSTRWRIAPIDVAIWTCDRREHSPGKRLKPLRPTSTRLRHAEIFTNLLP